MNQESPHSIFLEDVFLNNRLGKVGAAIIRRVAIPGRITLTDEVLAETSLADPFFRVLDRWNWNSLTTAMYEFSRDFPKDIDKNDFKIFVEGRTAVSQWITWASLYQMGRRLGLIFKPIGADLFVDLRRGHPHDFMSLVFQNHPLVQDLLVPPVKEWLEPYRPSINEVSCFESVLNFEQEVLSSRLLQTHIVFDSSSHIQWRLSFDPLGISIFHKPGEWIEEGEKFMQWPDASLSARQTALLVSDLVAVSASFDALSGLKFSEVFVDLLQRHWWYAEAFALRSLKTLLVSIRDEGAASGFPKANLGMSWSRSQYRPFDTAKIFKGRGTTDRIVAR